MGPRALRRLAVLGVAVALVGCGSSATATPAVPTPSTSPTPMPPTTDAAGNPILVGAGDIARCNADGDEQTASLLSTLPGIVFTLGDNAYDSGSAKELQDCYGPSWGKLLDRTAFVVTGNHDWETDHAKPGIDYFGSRMSRNGVTWYSQDVGTWHVILLDADCGLVGGCGPGSPQLAWLQADLSANTRSCTLALWHQPLFSSGTHGGDGEVRPFWDALSTSGAELVLNGHDHDYERFAPQTPDGVPDAARGITEIVVGTGGGDPRGFSRTAANSLVRSDHHYGVISVTLLPHGWTTTFTSTDGGFTDASSGTCH